MMVCDWYANRMLGGDLYTHAVMGEGSTVHGYNNPVVTSHTQGMSPRFCHACLFLPRVPVADLFGGGVDKSDTEFVLLACS